MKRFDSQRPLTTQLGPAERQEMKSPFRQPCPSADWATPLLQAVTVALLVALTAAVGILMTDPAEKRAALATGIMTFLITCTVTFILFTNRTHRALYHHLEHKPYNPPPEDRPILFRSSGIPTEPQTQPVTLPQRTVIDDCPYPEKTFHWFVWLCEKLGTGYEVWEKRLGRKRYVAYRNALINQGWARWLSYDAQGRPNTRQGWELTKPADYICNRTKVRSK